MPPRRSITTDLHNPHRFHDMSSVSTRGFSDVESETEVVPLPVVYSEDDLPSFDHIEVDELVEVKAKAKSSCCVIF